jgi:hypothetical protein
MSNLKGILDNFLKKVEFLLLSSWKKINNIEKITEKILDIQDIKEIYDIIINP